MEQTMIDLLAQEIQQQMDGVSIGHCARVNYLTTGQAAELCVRLNAEPSSFTTRLLATRTHGNSLMLSVDQAIEIRNKKITKLCLIIPMDLTDAAYSSLSNAFSVIDSRTVFKKVMSVLVKEISDDRAKHALRFVAHRPHAVPLEARIDYALAICAGEHAGLALWRIGLIADGGDDFDERLASNRTCVTALANPKRLMASQLDRIQTVGVDGKTTTLLRRFFQAYSMNDVRRWSQALVGADVLTFDYWKFSQSDRSTIQSVTLTRFLDKAGLVEKACKLTQIDTAKDGPLSATCGPKQTMVISWSCEPAIPANISAWNIRIVPADWSPDAEIDEAFDEPATVRIAGKHRKKIIKLEFEEDEIPEGQVCVYLAPLDAVGNEIMDEAKNHIYAKSDIFFFNGALETASPLPGPSVNTEQLVPTLDFGRLQLCCDAKWQSSEGAASPQLIERDGLTLISVTYPNRKKITVATSTILYELEQQVLATPSSLGIYQVVAREIQPLTLGMFHACKSDSTDLIWDTFQKKREDFFTTLRKKDKSTVIEGIEWTPQRTAKALEYVQAYTELLQSLTEHPHALKHMIRALSVDSVLIKVPDHHQEYQEAVVTLPTHPMRVAWYLGYVQLLQKWQQSLESLAAPARKKSFNDRWIALLSPHNVPFLSWHRASQHAFVFFKNLLFFHGVAIPVTVQDPNRLYGDIATLLGVQQVDDVQQQSLADRLKAHFERFQDLHPYVMTQCIALVNPDRGVEIANALLASTPASTDDTDFTTKFAITTYVADAHMTSLPAFDAVQEVLTQRQSKPAPYFTPNLSLTVRPLSTLQSESLPDSHIAIVMDYTKGHVTTRAANVLPETTGITLNGLMVRLDPLFAVDETGLTWTYALNIDPEKKFEKIQSSAKYTDILVLLYRVYMEAGGYHLSQQHQIPALTIRLDRQQMEQLERFHHAANWVITMDRFITLDYYDSPYLPQLSALARKYVVDYAPEVVENIGHRLMVTTAWRAELEDILDTVISDLGLTHLDSSIGYLLQAIKMVSGRLTLSVLDSSASAAGVIGLGVVALWLQRKKVLQKSILIPVDANQQLFWSDDGGHLRRRCDVMLVTLERSSLSFTFIEVKWRRNTTALASLAQDMATQVNATAQEFETIYQSETHIDAPLRRAYLNNVIRFYAQRARRYRLISEETEQGFSEQLAAMEKKITSARIQCQGYIVVPHDVQDADPFTVSSSERKVEMRMISADILAERFDNDAAPSESSNQPAPPSQAQNAAIPLTHVPAVATITGEVREEIILHEATEDLVKPDNAILIGEAQGRSVVWNPGVTGNPHLFIIGTPGQGKSWTMTRILMELQRIHVPALILDFHGQFADRTGPYVNAVHPTVLDAAAGLPFSPFDCTEEDAAAEWKASSYQLAEIIANVTKLGDMQKDAIYQAIRATYQMHGYTQGAFDATDIPTLEEVLRRITRLEQQGHIKNVSARCRVLFEMDLFKPTNPPINLITSIQAGLVIDLHHLQIDQVQVGAGAFILNKLYRDMFRWGPSDRLRLAIVLDEAHRLAKDSTLPRIMKEGRKFGIAVLVASQSVSDFHPDILPNAGTKICFRVNYPESNKIAAYLGQRAQEHVIERIQTLGVGQAFVQTPEMHAARLTQMLPPS